MKRLPYTHPLYKEIFELLLEKEYITLRHRIQIINAEMDGEWGIIEVNTIRPRCRKPSHYFKLAYFLPSGTVFWSKSEHNAL